MCLLIACDPSVAVMTPTFLWDHQTAQHVSINPRVARLVFSDFLRGKPSNTKWADLKFKAGSEVAECVWCSCFCRRPVSKLPDRHCIGLAWLCLTSLTPWQVGCPPQRAPRSVPTEFVINTNRPRSFRMPADTKHASWTSLMDVLRSSELVSHSSYL